MTGRLEEAQTSGLAIRELEGRGAVGAEAIDEFLAAHEFPIVEDTSVTFVWRGSATRVSLRHWIYGLPSSQPFKRLAPTDLWYLTLELPESSRVEYKIEVVRGRFAEWVEDPLNPRRARDPFGAISVCHTRGYEVPEWTRSEPDAQHEQPCTDRAAAFQV